jgi:hypothetical protein
MAIPFLNNLNLNDNQLLNAKVQVASTAPTAAKGQIYLDSTTNVNTFKYHDGSAWIGLKQLNLNNSTFVNLVDLSSTGSNIISLQASLNATGTPDNTKYLRGDNTWSAISGIYAWTLSDQDGSTVSIVNGNTVSFNGTVGQVITARAGTDIEISLDDNLVIVNSLTVTGTGQNSFGGQVTIPTTPVASTDAASKAYVDASVSGALVFQGGYNAATNTPNLDTPPIGTTIKKGFMWTVTADGLFFTEQVRVGDSLIANSDNPTTLSGWTTVQANIDLATLTTVGLGNVNAGTGIDVSYSNGTATVSATATSYATTISVTSTITHGLGTKDVMVQLYDTVTFDTVYADISRPTTNTVTITFSTAPTNPIRVLVQK